MKSRPRNLPVARWLAPISIGLLACSLASLNAFPIITKVVETGGDNEATDTITAKWTGVTWNTTIANEPTLNTPVGTPYTVPLFGDKVPCFVDRAHQWVAPSATLPIPAYLVGGEYVMIGNDNRDNVPFQLDITVSEEALVYLLVDNRRPDGNAADPPSNGLEPIDWTVMTWVAPEGFSALKSGLNRAANPDWPDEVGYDESADTTINNWASVYFKIVPAGTFSVYEFGQGANMYGVVVKPSPTSASNPPVISDVTPANNTLFYSAGSGLSFKAATIAPNRIDVNKVRLFLNGVDQSAGLVVGGSATSRTAAYSPLMADTFYKARIVVSDQAGRSTTNDLAFDTFSAATAVAVEAEDYNYDHGKYLDAPVPNGYAGFAGTPGIDYWDQNATGLSANYRPGDYAGLGAVGDVPREAFVNAGATDYALNALQGGEWYNYTRTLNGTYKVYLRSATPITQNVRFDKVGGDRTTTAQVPFAVGTFGTGLSWANNAFTYTPAADAAGNAVALSLAGVETLRLSALSANVDLQYNYLLFVPATGAARPPYLSAASPAYGETDVMPDATITLTLADGATPVTPSSVALTFDGAEVTSAATVTPVAGGVLVAYDPPGNLAFARPYPVSLTFKDNAGTTFSYQWTFTTITSVTLLAENLATPVGSGLGSGFNLKLRKAPNNNAAGTAFTLANTALRAEQQLADLIIDPDTTLPFINEAAGPNNDGVASGTMVNFNQTGPSAGYFGGDEPFPYIDLSATPDPNNIALEATSYLELPAGFHRFGVRSDDGFKLTVGPVFPNTNLVAGIFEGGRGNDLPGGATEFNLQVTKSGVYAFRLVYYEGNGGANVELYSVDRTTLKRTLLNDRATAGAIKAYTSRNPQIYVPTVAITSPAPGQASPTGPTDILVKATAAEVNGTITKVEFYAGATKIGESTAAPYQFNWRSVLPGRYTLTAKASDAVGFSTLSAPIKITVGTALVSVNFQAASTLTPDGYLPDTGEIYDDRGTGFKYGWDVDNVANARERNSANSPDKRYDTFNHLQKALPAGRFWEIEIPNNRYVVFAACGDADNFDSVFDLTAENVTIVKGPASDAIRFVEGQGMVKVDDGRLTIGNGPTAANNKVCFVEVYPITGELPKPEFTSLVLNGATLTMTWTGGGTLQEAPEVTGAWADVAGNPQGSYSVSATAPRRLYRVVIP